MSGKPYPEGAAKLAAQFRALENARQKIAQQENAIASHEQALADARSAERDATMEVHHLMKEMDVHAPGNFGYEQRMLWLLRELVSQSEKYGRMNP